MSRVLIVGYGNPMCGDDGLGWYAAHHLESLPWTQGMTVIWKHQLNPELAEIVSQVDLAIFIDARWGEKPGEIVFQSITRDEKLSGYFFTHHVELATLLTYAQEVYGHCPESIMVSISGREFGFSQRLSDPVVAVLPELWELLKAVITANEKALSPDA
jgi:hydrogenase maturation protease